MGTDPRRGENRLPVENEASPSGGDAMNGNAELAGLVDEIAGDPMPYRILMAG